MTSRSAQALHLQDPAYRIFLERHPSYRQTEALDLLRLREFGRLDDQGHTYLDYTGGCPYPACLVDHHRDMLQQSILGNPHSGHLAATASAALLRQARNDVLRYFNADPAEYLVIFTANASAALRLVGESYPFDENAEFLLTADNHNSVNGIREYAFRNGAAVRYIPCAPETLHIDDITPYLAATRADGHRLLAYPAQSNFSGLLHPLAWIGAAQAAGYEVILDAAAFVPTNRLDLGRIQPDYVTLSFYKMFGYPTGIGALIARRGSLSKLVRPSFSGGTVKMVSTQIHSHALHEDEAAFEDGTVNYLGLPAVSAGLHFLDSVGIDTIHRRVTTLAAHLLDLLRDLRHTNGRPAMEIYGTADMSRRGGTIAFNLRDPDGAYLQYETVEQLAGLQGISLRSGCFCNPGAAEAALSHNSATVAECLPQAGEVLDLARYRDCLHRCGKAMGAVRASLGMGSNFRDICQLIEFLSDLLDRPAAEFSARA
jgi:selenocysteine lyase/cysteine desulfurase